MSSSSSSSSLGCGTLACRVDWSCEQNSSWHCVIYGSKNSFTCYVMLLLLYKLKKNLLCIVTSTKLVMMMLNWEWTKNTKLTFEKLTTGFEIGWRTWVNTRIDKLLQSIWSLLYKKCFLCYGPYDHFRMIKVH